MSNVMSEFVKANCQKAVRQAPPMGSFYIVDEKINGTRVFLWSREDKVLLATKHNGIYGKDTTDASGKLLYADLFADIHVEPGCILDCELVRSTQKLYPFDILFFQNRDVRGLTLLERKGLLGRAIQESGHVQVLSYWTVKERVEVDALFDEIVSRGGEGVMIKADLPYTSPGSWFKRKNEDTDDLFVVGFGKGKKGETTYRMAEYQDGQVKEIGEVYSAIKEVEADLPKVALGTVLEIRFGYIDGVRIFPGVILRVREDKVAQECVA